MSARNSNIVLPGSPGSPNTPSLVFPFNTWRDYNRAMRNRRRLIQTPDLFHGAPAEVLARHVSDDVKAQLDIAFTKTNASVSAQNALQYGLAFAGTGLAVGGAIGGPWGALVGAVVGAVAGTIYGAFPWAWYDFLSHFNAIISPLDNPTRYVLWSHFRDWSNHARQKAGATPMPAWRIDDGQQIQLSIGGSLQTLVVMMRHELFFNSHTVGGAFVFDDVTRVEFANIADTMPFEQIASPMFRYILGVFACRGEDNNPLWDGVTFAPFGGITNLSQSDNTLVYQFETGSASGDLFGGAVNSAIAGDPNVIFGANQVPYDTVRNWVNGAGKRYTVGQIRRELIRPSNPIASPMADIDAIPNTPNIATVVEASQGALNGVAL